MNDDANLPSTEHANRRNHHGHGLMMVVCVPMLLIAMLLVLTGVANPGVLVGAGMCVVMMTVMMRGLSNARR